MTRWIGRRGLWGVVAGTAVAAGAGVVAAAEPGDVVVFKEGAKDRKVTVVKANKRADGSVEVHGKDAAGEAVVWVEGGPGDTPPAPPAAGKTATTKATPPAAKDAAPPKAKARTDDPMAAAAAPVPETPAERDRRLFNGKLLGRDNPPAPGPAAAAPQPPQVAEAAEPKGKTGVLGRLFGKKTAAAPAAMPGPAAAAAAPPPVKAGPAAAGEPRVAAPTRPPVATPTPPPVLVPAPTTAIPVPMPLPAARPPAPAAPPAAVPVPTPLPSIPTAPTGARPARPGDAVPAVLPVGYVPAAGPAADDIRPYAAALANETAPSARLVGAFGLANGRHGSSEPVKDILFAAAKADPAPTVRAGCLDYLNRLGYAHPDFVRYVHTLAEGPAGEERDAARAAVARLTPRTW